MSEEETSAGADETVEGVVDAAEETAAEDEASGAVPATPTESLDAALAAKLEGNARFLNADYDGAIDLYSQAIELVGDDRDERATFYANRAACHAKLGEHELVVDDCSSAIALRPDYAKALHRRAAAREALGECEGALQDMKRVVELEPSNQSAVSSLPRLDAAAKAKLEQQKEEMMGKLKDLGNSVLGRFGMSLDNFKAVQDPDTGSYNISFNPGGS